MTRILTLVTLGLSSVAGAAVMPYSLECEARKDPVGIDAARPRLSWKLKSGERNQAQTAYRILVATSEQSLANDAGDLWDSGKVTSPRNMWIEYAGTELSAFQRVWWKVRTWDAGDQPSPWSAPAQWTETAMTASDWKSSWIAHPDHTLRSGPLPVFRKEFAVEKPVRRALAVIAGAGFHELHINGKKVGDHVLAPAWTNFRATVDFETFDVTSLIHEGANALGLMLGNGFYNVAGGRYAKYTASFGHLRVSMMLHLEFEDGTASDVGTDATWKAHDGPITFSCIYGGEDYDARLEMPGWDTAGFADGGWLPVSSWVEAPGGKLVAQSSPPVKVQQTLSPVSVKEPKPGVFVYDLGLNFSGWPKITVRGQAGARVRLTPGELLDSAGLASQESSGGPEYFSYTLKGGGTETWAPRFSYYGFRYVQVDVEGTAKVEKLEGEFVHLDAARAGEFSCSKELFNQIHKLIDTAVRSNLQHVLTDCPHREKLGWLEQSYLMGPSLLYNWDLRTFLPKVLRDIRDAQTFDGLIPDIAPEYVVFGGGFRDSPEWGSAGVMLPWLAWEWYGDKQALAGQYRSMKAYVEYLDARTKDGLLTYGLGDWYDIGPRGPGESQLTPQGVTATATYWRDLQVLQRAALLLGKSDDQTQFLNKAETTEAAFQKAYFGPASTTYATGSQTSLAMPLALGMVPEPARAGLLEKLVADIRAKGNHTSAGDIGYTYVVSALTKGGRSDVVYDLANEPGAPSYAAQLAHGATSLTEAWDANPHSSQNHLMLGHMEQWFYAGLAGIRLDPANSGMDHLLIHPEPVGDVTWVKASLETVRGLVAVNWKIEGGTFHLRVEIPPGTTADVTLPGATTPKAIGSGAYQYTVAGFAASK